MTSDIKRIKKIVETELNKINTSWDQKVFKLNQLNLFNVIYNLIYLKGKKEAYKRIGDELKKIIRQDDDAEE